MNRNPIAANLFRWCVLAGLLAVGLYLNHIAVSVGASTSVSVMTTV